MNPASNFCEQGAAGHVLDREARASRITVAADINRITREGSEGDRPDRDERGPGVHFGTGTFYTPLVGCDGTEVFDDRHGSVRKIKNYANALSTRSDCRCNGRMIAQGHP